MNFEFGHIHPSGYIDITIFPKCIKLFKIDIYKLNPNFGERFDTVGVIDEYVDD